MAVAAAAVERLNTGGNQWVPGAVAKCRQVPPRLPFAADSPRVAPKSTLAKRNAETMSDTFAAVADIIAAVCSIDRETIRPESPTITDLGIASLDFPLGSVSCRDRSCQDV